MSGNAQTTLPLILLSCETSLKEFPEAELEAICDTLHSEMEQKFPDRTVVSLGEQDAGAARGVEAALLIQALRPDHIKGVLQWQNLETNETHSGPSLQVDGMDGAPIGRLIESFARDVLRVSLPPWEK